MVVLYLSFVRVMPVTISSLLRKLAVGAYGKVLFLIMQVTIIKMRTIIKVN